MWGGGGWKREPKVAPMGKAEKKSTLADVLDLRLNALNALRLVLAVSVIVWYTFAVTGAVHPPAPVTQLLGQGGVDGFFAISGFLIVSSWLRRPHWWPYLRARFLRILPGFWVCLVVTVLVLAPIGVLLTGHGFPHSYMTDSVLFVVKNAALRINEFGIAGTPQGVPYPGVWNGSLWTLWWEFLCYLVVLALGLTRVLRFRVTVPLAFVACLVVMVLSDLGVVHNFYLVNGARFGIMFAAGALIQQFQRLLPARWWLVGVAALVIAGSAFLPDYRVIAALPLAYLLIAVGALVKVQQLRLENDVSYGTYIYAFPVQQVLACAGLSVLGVPLFAAVATALTLGLATLSWYAVEKPAMRLKNVLRRRAVVAAPAVPPGTARPTAAVVLPAVDARPSVRPSVDS